jgi:hypothetical protein
MPSHRDFLIDDIMPEREVHLLGGPSGVGKTTLAIQIIKSLQLGQPVFDKPIHLRGVVYVSCDRTSASLRRAMDRHSLPHDAFPWTCVRDIPDPLGIEQVFSWRKRTCPDCHLMVVDGFARLVPDGKISDYKAVADFLTKTAGLCESHDVTILGIVHATKVKSGEHFPDPRQRILGSVAWGAFADLLIIMDAADPNNSSDQTRIIHVLPRDHAESSKRMVNDSGRLVDMETYSESQYFGVMYSELKKYPEDLTTADLHQVGATYGISRSTVERWITDAVDHGKLEHPARGKYRKVPAK